MDLISEALEVLMTEAFLPNEYVATFEKSSFGGYRAKVNRKNSSQSSMYLGSAGWKTPELATGEAKAYIDGYFQGGPNRADQYVSDYRKKNKSEIVSK